MRKIHMLIGAVILGLIVLAEQFALVSSASAAQQRPNVVLVVTDDQRTEEMQYMPLASSLLSDRGTTFSNFFCSYPLCAPSRASMLTGQYMHNHGNRTLSAPDGGYDQFDWSNHLGVWLQRAGYRTAHIGKPINGYGVRYVPTPDQLRINEVPKGYDDWFASLDPTTYEMYGTVYNDNGLLLPGLDYQTDTIANRAVSDIRKWAPGDKPFFMQVSTSAPHSSLHDGDGGPQAAPRHEGSSAGMAFQPDPSFNEEDVSDKTSIVRQFRRFSPQEQDVIVQRQRDRVESLQAIDEMVGRIVATLKHTGELDNTVIMYVSDNGWYNGEHRWFSEKIDSFEPAISVPFVVRGPGFPAGATRTQLASNIDIAPTIVELAGATPGRTMDGESLLPFAAKKSYRHDRALNIEAAWPGTSGVTAIFRSRYNGVQVMYEGVRTRRYKYVEYYKDVHGMPAREEQLYDLRTDPHELNSLHKDPAHAGLKVRLRATLERLRKCKGDACHQSFATKVAKPKAKAKAKRKHVTKRRGRR